MLCCDDVGSLCRLNGDLLMSHWVNVWFSLKLLWMDRTSNKKNSNAIPIRDTPCLMCWFRYYNHIWQCFNFVCYHIMTVAKGYTITKLMCGKLLPVTDYTWPPWQLAVYRYLKNSSNPQTWNMKCGGYQTKQMEMFWWSASDDIMLCQIKDKHTRDAQYKILLLW